MNEISKMSTGDLKARAYDLIAASQSISQQLQMINDEIAKRQTAPTKPAEEKQLELPLEYKEEPEA